MRGCRDQEFASRRSIGQKVTEILAKIGEIAYIKAMSIILFFAARESWNDDQFYSVKKTEGGSIWSELRVDLFSGRLAAWVCA